MTAISLFMTNNELHSYRYVYEYGENDSDRIEEIPFVFENGARPAERNEIKDYYSRKASQSIHAETFSTINTYRHFLEDQYHIISDEWDSIIKINSTEGGIEKFFDDCKKTNNLFDRLLIPTVESAIAGFDANTFPDTFDERRAGFKLYKELKSQIGEYESIEDELNQYVQQFQSLHDQQQQYLDQKSEAKAILRLAVETEMEQQKKIESTQTDFETFKLDERRHKRKKASYEIRKEEAEFEHEEEHFLMEKEKWDSAKEALSLNEKLYYSLQLAEQKEKADTQKQLKTQYEDTFDQLINTEETADLTEEIQQNRQEMKGYFDQAIESFQKEKQSLHFELNPITQQLTELEGQRKEQFVHMKKEEATKNQLEGKIDRIKDDMDRISQRLLSNPDQESIKQLLPLWMERETKLDNEIVQLKTDDRSLRDQIHQLNEKKEEADKTILQHQRELDHVTSDLRLFDEEHDRVIKQLGQLRLNWSHLQSVYLKQEQIQRQMAEKKIALEKERQELLVKERLAHRFVDDYGKQDVFFAEPFIAERLADWSNQFSLLETGTHYIESASKTISELTSHYPFWSVTLITTSSDTQRLRQKISTLRNRLLFPINIIDTEEARQILNGEQKFTHTVTPSHWSSNIDQDVFLSWKEEVKTHAELSKKEREHVEENIRLWDSDSMMLQGFLERFSYEKYQQKDQVKKSAEELLRKATSLQQHYKKQMVIMEEKMVTQQRRIQDLEQEKTGVSQQLEYAHDYLNLEKEYNHFQQKQHDLAVMLKGLERKLSRIEKDLVHFSEEKNRMMDALATTERQIQSLLQDPVLKNLQNEKAIYTDKPRILLEEKNRQLELKQLQINQSLGEWQEKIKRAQDNIKNAENRMVELLNEHDSLDEMLRFPANGREQLRQALGQMQERKKNVAMTQSTYEKQANRYNEKKFLKNQLLSQYKDRFPNEDVISFDQNLSSVKTVLIEEKQALIEKETFLQQTFKRLQNELDNTKEAIHHLEKFEEAHHFNGPSIKPDLLNEEKVYQFTYERQTLVRNTTNSLRSMKEVVEKHLGLVEKRKQSFRDFCRQTMSDVKMRENLVQGIERKNKYDDVLAFQQNIRTKIDQILRYNEESIRNHDAQLEQFITHVQQHLSMITRELEIIPKKTKMKVEDQWKQIYQFSIPQWDEQEGKKRLRDHVEWILNQLENEKFFTDEGKENAVKVRKEIETWLNTTQLLRVVLNNQVMKISCRKVTNENQVTSRSYSWEQTNDWSGGEKWSKNMTLFLGILNYVAEKKKHVETSMKRHRTVILDNPFGKASSDHVLSPVFFIAEQLGFQIISLTAHAEGKFLRDYFPVIYSCRLRSAKDSNKKVMTKEKHLHHAFFQDHEPDALERLGDKQQMELF